MPSREVLERAIEHSQNAFTTYNRFFSPDDPVRRLLGQSGPTALRLQDELGGTILSQLVQLPTGDTSEHFSLRVGDEIIDPTRPQYDFYAAMGGVAFDDEIIEVDRAVFDKQHPQSMLYHVLCRNVDLVLGE